MPKTRAYGGYEFLLDDAKGCYIEVSTGGLVGYVGVNLEYGTPENQFCWWMNARYTEPSGLRMGNVAGPLIEDNLLALMEHFPSQRALMDAHKEFDPKMACRYLHEYMDELES